MSAITVKKNTRIAIVNPDLCAPNKCNQECKKSCPVNKVGKDCISITDRKGSEEKIKKIANISEELCIGCNICVKACPFGAIQIINLPTELPTVIHQYSANSFKLCNLPIPRAGTVLGIVGENGTGKSSSLLILGNKMRPNFGEYESSPEYKEILKYFRGTELQNYFSFIYSKNPKVIVKPQYVESIQQGVKSKVKDIIVKLCSVSKQEYDKIAEDLSIEELFTKDVENLSGGELQRFAITCSLIQEADIYMFDEPSSYLDIRQRVKMAKCIRDILLPKNKYVIVIEHDISILDYLSDYICCLYGQAGAYGIVSPPFTSGEGINIYLNGFVPTDNTRFRDEPLDYKFATIKEENIEVQITNTEIQYPKLNKVYPGFTMNIEAGTIRSSEIICILGSNGAGKSMFIKMLCGMIKPDNTVNIPVMNVSYKPQILKSTFNGTVIELLYNRIPDAMTDAVFKSDVLKPINIERLYDHHMSTLSGGELQRIGIILALGKPAHVLLLDEPSSFLDVHQRLIVAKAIKKHVMNTKKYCFLVEHDFVMTTYLCDRVIVLEKTGEISSGSSPMGYVEGFNAFLKILGITFRRDTRSLRPRINKIGSTKDQEQKKDGTYFYTENITAPISSFITEEKNKI